MARGKWLAVVLVFAAIGAALGFLLVTVNPNSAFVLPTFVPTARLPTIATGSPDVVPADTPPLPPKELTICQAFEPSTLFVYGGPSRAALNVLEAIYDGPTDARSYQLQPVILEKLPSLSDGDVVVRSVQAQEGERVVDVMGQVVDLAPGVVVPDADGQQVTFQGEAVTMPQMVVTFTLRADVAWADGQPVTADDSRYAFELAGEFDSLPLQLDLLRERTQSYNAVGERTVVWTSVPGYRDMFYFHVFPLQNLYSRNFFHPLPRHVWGATSGRNLLNAEVASRRPLGWGAFALEEWVAGQYISLVRNPHYFRADEGLPYLDRITLRFVPNLGRALDLFLAGDCDLLTQDVIEGGDPERLLEAAEAGQVQLISSPSSEWEHLDFGITPASWIRRPDYFGDVRVRQAIAQCVDRERVARDLPFFGEAVVAHSYIPEEHPLYAGGQLYRWDYSPAAGRVLLEEAGWRDEDGDGIREARSVTGVAYGTPFSVTLLTTADDPAREQAARVLVENLAECGIGLTVDYLPTWEFIADGPDGPVLGRQFQLALHSWHNDLYAPCELYLSSQIPGPQNLWFTSNNPGYASDEYDAACQAALDALPGTSAHARYHAEAQRIFTRDLPVLPLYFVPKVVAARPAVSGVILDPSQYLELWNIEAFDLGTSLE